MTDFNHDLAALRAMLSEFEPFVMSDEVFWELSDRGPALNRYPKLTLGGLLLLVQRLQHPAAPPTAAPVLAEQAALFDRWRSNIQRKAQRELANRLNAWQWFLTDCADQPRPCHDYYPTEVYARTYITFLLNLLTPLDTPEITRLREQVALADGQLRRYFRAGPFIWEPPLAPAFDSQTFWYLYGRPTDDR